MDESDGVRIQHTNSTDTDMFEDNFKPTNQKLKRSNVLSRKRRSVDSSSWDATNSVLETLRHIQEENPQIETIFLESDDGGDDEDEEEDDDNSISDSDTTIGPVDPIGFSSKHDICTIQQTNAILHPENSQVKLTTNRCVPSNHNSPFTVREVSPYKIPSSLIQNSNTIALQDESKGFAPKRYLVIPKEVVPIFANSKGPISLNVPGIGPLLIQKPSEIISGPNAQLDLQSCLADLSAPLKKEHKTPEYNPLCDPKFYCWRFRKGVKRDLDGFSMYDRLGFYKAEQRRGFDCIAKLKFVALKLEQSIAATKRKLSASCTADFTQFESTKRKRGRKRKLTSNEQVKEKKHPKDNFGKKKKGESVTTISDTDSLFSNDDLLLTRKVVVLNNPQSTVENTFTEKRRPGRPRKYPIKTPSQLTGKRRPGRPRKNSSPPKYSFQESNNSPAVLKGKRGRPRKIRNSIGEEMMSHYKTLYNVAPCYILVDHREIPQEVLKNYVTSQYPDQFEVIDNLKEFESKIDAAKPLLVVNEKQWGTLNLLQVSEANNMVYPVTDNSKIPLSMTLSAVAYNLRFVKPDVLFRHLSGEKIGQ